MKTYKIAYDWWEATIKIDEEKAKEAIKEMVEFWMGWESRLGLNDGDYTKTFLQQLSRNILIESMDYNLHGIISKYDDREGWTKMDGSKGIEIISVNNWEFYENNFEIGEG